MKLISKFTASLIVLGGLLSFLLIPVPVSAVPLEGNERPGSGSSSSSGVTNCGGVQTSFNYFCRDATKEARVVEQTPVFAFMVSLMGFLAYGVGLAVVFGILIGAYHIITANGSSSKVEQGALTIWNSIIGLVLFIFMFAIVNFLVPGGLFK